jgi:hypothetical protein
MKKVLLLLAIVTFVGSIFTSCKSHERCPAYGKATQATEAAGKSV